MITWPPSLITEIAERRCVIFMGSGASAGAVPSTGSARLPTWVVLLQAMSDSLLSKSEDKDEVASLLGKDKFLEAAQVIRDGSLPAEFSSFIDRTFVKPRYKASKLHESIYSLDAKIVISPNYDTIFEDYCKQYSGDVSHNVCTYYQSHALNNIRSDKRVILKMHGCVTDPDKIVLSRSDYFEARRQWNSFYSILDAIFLTSTILFLGAGLSDPDVQLILENAQIAAPSTNHHYAVIGSGRHHSEIAALKKTNNIHVLEYPEGDFTSLECGLESLVSEVEAYRSAP
jgi:hypothetical protein